MFVVVFALGGISIHAPARGATATRPLLELCHMLFQSTLPHGERPLLARIWSSPHTFQSTLPHGERRRRLRSFSARPPISIHAPARGATETWTVQRVTFLFQSTLPHGERRQSWPSSSEMVGISIHAPARGATALEMAVEDDLIRFQSTLPHGERR